MPSNEPTPVTATYAAELEAGAQAPPLQTLYLYIAGACNLACQHCWITPIFKPGNRQAILSEYGTQFLRLEHLESVIEQGKPLGLKAIKLTGGEPTLHPYFRDIITTIHGAGLRILMETNGTLIDPELAQFLKEHTLAFISVSLDGASRQTHEAVRIVENSYADAIRGIKNLVEVGFHPQVICTLHQNNEAEMGDLVALAEGLGCSSVKFNLLQKMGRGERYANDVGLSVERIIELNDYVHNTLMPQAPIGISFDIPMAFYPINRLLHDSLNVCNMRTILGMLSDGHFSLCGVGVNIPELIFGHIATDPLREVWEHHPALQQLRREVPGELDGICGQCIHRTWCQAQCVANNYHANQRFTGANPFCARAEELGLFPSSRKTIPKPQEAQSAAASVQLRSES